MISDEYRAILLETHKNERWGNSAHKHVPAVVALINEIEAKSVLDYGCGKGSLFNSIPVTASNINTSWHQYDPGILLKDEPPTGKYDLVCCIDVLEHIEPEHLDITLVEIKELIKKLGYFVISTRKAVHILPDGRNAHLIIRSAKWWMNVIADIFPLMKTTHCPPRDELYVTVASNDYDPGIFYEGLA